MALDELTLSVDDYRGLLRKAYMLDNILTIVYGNATLTWDEAGLSTLGDDVMKFLKIADHEHYEAVLSDLKTEKE